MASNQHRHETLNKREKIREDRKPTYRVDLNTCEGTEAQRKYARDMVEKCESLGIDLSFARPRFYTKDDCHRMVNLSYTMLKKHGYDEHGNKLKGE